MFWLEDDKRPTIWAFVVYFEHPGVSTLQLGVYTNVDLLLLSLMLAVGDVNGAVRADCLSLL
jgi:hypothetical protein